MFSGDMIYEIQKRIAKALALSEYADIPFQIYYIGNEVGIRLPAPESLVLDGRSCEETKDVAAVGPSFDEALEAVCSSYRAAEAKLISHGGSFRIIRTPRLQ